MLERPWDPQTLTTLLIWGALAFPPLPLSVTYAESGQKFQMERGLLLPNEHVVLGTVQQVKSDVMQVNINHMEPVYLSVRTAAEKGIPTIEPGDKLKIAVSNHNQIIDFHKADDPGWDRVLKGRLHEPFIGDHMWAVVQTEAGTKGPYKVDEGARHTLMNIPVGVPTLFLLNKHNILIDATSGDEGVLLNTLAQWSKDRQQVVHD